MCEMNIDQFYGKDRHFVAFYHIERFKEVVITLIRR